MTDRDISWIVVDLGGVAAQFRPERRLEALERATRIPRDVIQQRLFQSGLDDDAELGHHSVQSITDTILSSLEHRISVPALIDAWSLAFEPNLELLDAIRSLAPARALFTNNGPMIDLCLSGPLARLASAFDVVIGSWHIAATKPNPEAFARAATRLRSAPPELLLVDDSQPNVDAAHAAGWDAVTHVSNEATLARIKQRLAGATGWICGTLSQ
jgi:HAD superfamily hydrolase (TIGR01509 family)